MHGGNTWRAIDWRSLSRETLHSINSLLGGYTRQRSGALEFDPVPLSVSAACAGGHLPRLCIVKVMVGGTLGNRILHSRIASAARQPLEHGAPLFYWWTAGESNPVTAILQGSLATHRRSPLTLNLADVSGFEPDLHSFGDRPRPCPPHTPINLVPLRGFEPPKPTF